MKRTDLMHDDNEIHRMWNNLLNSLLNLSFNQNISIVAILSELLTQLKRSRVHTKSNRDWLMWFLFKTISANIARMNKVIDLV